MSATAHRQAHGTPTDGVWRTVIGSAGMRILVLPISAILGIINTRLIISHFGSDSFAQYGLLVGIGSLIPFADLGMSAALMNAVAASKDPGDDPHVKAILTTAVRVLTASACAIVLVSAVITLGGWWNTLLGAGLLPNTGATSAALCAAMIGIAMPVGIGQRLWTGMGRNQVPIAVLGLQTPIVLVCLAGIITFRPNSGSYLPLIPYLVTFALSVALTLGAGRRLGPSFWQALRDAPHLRSIRGGRVLDVAWPTLIQMIALPIAMQTDRLILSHVSNAANLAEYNLASQMYLPIWQVVSSAGIALWPVFARSRASGDGPAVSPLRMSAAFGGAAAVIALLITLGQPWLAARASAGRIHLDLALVLWFAVFMVFQATKYPLGMYMTDPRGLRYQAWMILLVLLPVNLGLSWVLAIHLGAVGPVIGSTIGVFFCQVLANFVFVRRDLRERAAGAAERAAVTSS
jgi:O-antigen/teichoic acid export membrane protein